MYKVLQDTPDVDSIHLFDNAGNQYSISRVSRQNQPRIVLRETDWYKEAVAAKGAYVLRLNGGGAFPGDEDGNRVSLIRTVRDINTTDSIGTLVVNLSEDAFHQAFGTISQQYASGFYLLDERGTSVLRSAPLSEDRKEELSAFLASGGPKAEELRLDGVLEPWDIRAGNREILQLRDNYNRMIERIRLLLHRVVEEQKTKRRHELNVLQAQRSPRRMMSC